LVEVLGTQVPRTFLKTPSHALAAESPAHKSAAAKPRNQPAKRKESP
jgi:hypothetical protein